MCGIVGFAGWDRPSEQNDRELTAMCGRIVHRGPDDEGHFVAPGVAMGMRRLSIIDVARGHQPISNEDGTVSIVYNGEVYNHRELQRSLESAGHTFRTHSDTEALVHLYEERGDDMVRELRGMFAFSIWDERRQRLLVARDRLGIKPLFYAETQHGVVYGSELRSLLAFSGFRAEIDPAAVVEYLTYGYVPDGQSIYRGVKKLPPGHRLTWDRRNGVQVSRYWEPARAEVAMDEQEAVTELRRILEDAVSCHLESEVPLGAFLSGGIDSSAVVAQMTRLLDTPVRTFSIGFEEKAYNEAPDAAIVAKALGTSHTELIARPDVDELVEQVILGFDEPFSDSSAIPTFLVSRLAREQVTVALSGDGGDELFAGYRRYGQTMARSELPAPVRAALAPLARLLPHGARGRNRLLDIARSRSGQYAATVLTPPRLDEGGVVRADVAGGQGRLETLLDELFARGDGRDFITQMTLVDIGSYLPGDILTKVDRMSMQVSLEARVPLLDHHLVEFAVSLPSHLKLRDGTGKWIFRQAIRDMVPERVLTKPKHGFGVPLDLWFRNELRYRLDRLASHDSPIFAYVDAAAAQRLVREHLASRRDHAHMLWRLLVLDIWPRAFESGAHAVPAAAGRAAEVRTPALKS